MTNIHTNTVTGASHQDGPTAAVNVFSGPKSESCGRQAGGDYHYWHGGLWQNDLCQEDKFLPLFRPLTFKKIRSTNSTSSKTSLKESPSGEVGQAGAQDSAEAVETNNETDSPRPSYILNLDPAVTYMPFEANIDIKDAINYSEVMKRDVPGTCNHLSLVHRRRYPTTSTTWGGILTALNLFTTTFDQVLGTVEKRAESVE
ncbi:hypothetical protein FRC04_011294 [Tulasnella sp. 424]|nr:hypothetical protein FRC04_011294 [Tulasnella sp. 424]KAG8971830.1 hypothetical protein FRC05_010791 [Tulasnella sp. 425]